MATRVVEWKKPYTWWKAISIDENKVISLNLRDENNLIIYDEWDDEIYVDLQLDDEITPTDAFPIWVNTGRVIVDNWWDKAWTIISAVTTSGDNIKILYADEWTLWMDNWTWTFKQIYFKADVDAIAQAIWDYIYANCNTKSFWRGAAWQDVYDRISSGNNYALVNKEQNGNGTNEIFMFWPTNVTTGEVSSFPAHLSQQSVWWLFYEETNVLKFDVTDWVASNIWASGTVIHNNGMLIIKDDSAPSDAIEWTTWYDTTNDELKVWNWTAWQSVGWSDIVYATQAEYNALLPWAASDWKHYFIYSTSGWWGWQPWVDTIAYFPFSEDFNDKVWSRTLTVNQCTISWWYANVSGTNSYMRLSSTIWGTDITINCWYYYWGTSPYNTLFCYLNWGKHHALIPSAIEYWPVWQIWFYNDSISPWWFWGNIEMTTGNWYNIVITKSWTNEKIYVNWVSAIDSNNSFDNNSSPVWVIANSWANSSANQWSIGKFSEVIFEDKVWTAQEISDYYNQTKVNYWIS